jgi:hypothetical protein
MHVLTAHAQLQSKKLIIYDLMKNRGDCWEFLELAMGEASGASLHQNFIKDHPSLPFIPSQMCHKVLSNKQISSLSDA